MTSRLKDLLDQQINSLLTKIDEEVGSDHDEEEEEEEEEQEDDEEMHVVRHRNHNDSPQHLDEEQSPSKDNLDDVNHVVYTEENFEYLTAPPAQPPQLTDEEIREMHMKALSATYLKYQDEQIKLHQYTPIESVRSTYELQ